MKSLVAVPSSKFKVQSSGLETRNEEHGTARIAPPGTRNDERPWRVAVYRLAADTGGLQACASVSKKERTACNGFDKVVTSSMRSR